MSRMFNVTSSLAISREWCLRTATERLTMCSRPAQVEGALQLERGRLHESGARLSAVWVWSGGAQERPSPARLVLSTITTCAQHAHASPSYWIASRSYCTVQYYVRSVRACKVETCTGWIRSMWIDFRCHQNLRLLYNLLDSSLACLCCVRNRIPQAQTAACTRSLTVHLHRGAAPSRKRTAARASTYSRWCKT